MNTAVGCTPQIWTPFGHYRAVGTPYMNAQALGLNGQAILYSPPGTGTIRHDPRQPHVCVWKRSMTPSKPTLPSNQAFVVQFRTRPRGTPSWEGRCLLHPNMCDIFSKATGKRTAKEEEFYD